MDFHAMLALALPLGLGIAALGGALGMGRAVSSALEALARQPEVGGKILVYLIIGCAFIETLIIYVLVFAFMYGGKIG